MIGFYNYTVILTYIGLLSSIAGMMFAVNGWYKAALLCLAFSGLCDMFDGKIARRKTDRTEDEKSFGIQIDSLCDMVCFGVFPILLAYSLGMNGPIGILILAIYGVCGVIRLGYFNVMEIKRQQETSENRKYYSGLPITSISVIMPLVYMIRTVMVRYFFLLLHCSMLATGMLFVVNFKMRKPKNSTLAVLVIIVALALLRIFHVF
ncbi:MAG: CDP-alcohol phosphatidyltransferase family protein [Oliverpabstia sp.]|nr:CDP-alcohol phosphatidyltransferase family protein [Lachnospiraceae bacterium]MDY5025891.1 CDP-alcohol phosphatidyltransferase family protein [Oliverpabstia sp.]